MNFLLFYQILKIIIGIILQVSVELLQNGSNPIILRENKSLTIFSQKTNLHVHNTPF